MATFLRCTWHNVQMLCVTLLLYQGDVMAIDVGGDGGVLYNGVVYVYGRYTDMFSSTDCKGRCTFAKLDGAILPDNMRTPVAQYLRKHVTADCARIGMSKIDGDWLWVDGSPVTNVRWKSDGFAGWVMQALLDCGYLCLMDGVWKWRKMMCSARAFAIWQYVKESTTRGEVATVIEVADKSPTQTSVQKSTTTSEVVTVTEAEDRSPTQTFALLTSLGRRSIKPLFEPLWTIRSSSVVSCGALCLGSSGRCDVIRFDKSTQQCVGYTLDGGLGKGNDQVDYGSVFWKVSAFP